MKKNKEVSTVPYRLIPVIPRAAFYVPGGDASMRRGRGDLHLITSGFQYNIEWILKYRDNLVSEDIVCRFLAEYLVEWNGRDHFVQILELTRFLQITDFQELYDTILSPIEAHFHTYTLVEQVSRS